MGCPNCMGCYDERDNYCYFVCPYEYECEEETYTCFGYFDEWDDYCYYECPYSYECERDKYWFSCSSW